MMIKIKRIYDPCDPDDGWRVLVDRIWPRGISKERAHLDEWRTELAPSPELREWFCHIPEKFAEFSIAYRAELDNNPEIQKLIMQILEKSTISQVTLLYSAKDSEHNQAVVLRDYLNEKAGSV
ncbi:MAG TPA: DUF488 domain-containing protein [Anaerolineaceae bacterium]|jgi:uncharacterized protein YeaO (DUF488 family)|nr:DUF488 domain-containing protein [Anaerolineaceae bacterium]